MYPRHIVHRTDHIYVEVLARGPKIKGALEKRLRKKEVIDI